MQRYRRLLIALAIVIVLLVAYAAAGFLALPHFARKYAQDFVRTHYGRTLALGEIHFNPFTLKLDVRRVALPDADGQTLLSFERLYVDLQFASVWRLGPSFKEISLEQPYVRAVIRPNGALNLADLGKGFPPPPPGPPKPAKPLRLFIQQLAIVAGASSFEDRTRSPAFRADFKPINFELRDFSTKAGTADAYSLNAASPEGERLAWNGTLRLEPLASHGTFVVADLKARTVWSYLRSSVPFELDSGVIGIKGDYDLASGGGPLGVSVDVHDVSVTRLGIKPKGGTQNYIDIAQIEVTDTRVDVTRHTVNVAKVAVSGGDIKAWMSEQGQINLLELAPGGASQSGSAGATAPPIATAPATDGTSAAAATPAPGSTSWTVAVPDIALQGFKVSAEDRQVKPAATVLLSALNVHVAGFNTSPGDTLDITLDSAVNESGKIAARAKVTPRGGAVSAHLETENLGLTMLQPFIAQYTSMTLLKGTLGTRLDLERRADGALEVSGNTAVSDLRTIDNELKLDFIKWRTLRVADIRYRSTPASLRIGSVTALEPYVRMVIAPNRTLNITEVMTPPGAAPAGKPAAKAKAKSARAAGGAAAPPPAVPAKPLTPFPMSIGTITFVNGSANYSDLWIKPSFSVGIQALGGTVKGLSSDPRSRAKADLNGKVDRYAPVRIAGELNLLSAALYTDITMSFKDVDLTIVNPYSGHFAGYKIDKGKLSVDVTYKIDQRKLDAKQHFVVDQLELGDRVESPDAVHLPLKIAVALLKDRNGVIDLDLPMNGSLDDPKFKIGPIIWKMVVNLIVKVATAPFALLGHLFGGGEHPNIIEFAAGSAELDKPSQDQLASIAKALKERPQLKLDVPIVYSPSIDKPQMAATKLRAELLAREQGTREGKKHPDTAGELALADPEKHFKLLVEQFHADLGKDTPLPPTAVAVQQAKRKETPPYDPAINDLNAALIDHIAIEDGDLQGLGKRRAQAIQDALLSDGQIDPGRVFIVNASPKGDSGDKVKVELALK
jgi:uncharacterized protein DUF748